MTVDSPVWQYAQERHKRRVCAYARVSTDKEDQANSYESQCKFFIEYIQQHSEWEFAGIYADEGISGTNTRKRDSFRRMIIDAEEGRIDLILTKEVSRFARNTVDTLTYTRELKKRGIYIIFLNDNINTQDNDGELRLSIMATIAQDESRKTSERVKWGQKRRMEQGVVFGRDMIGYSVRGGKLYLKEDEAEVVRLIFHKFTNEGKGTHVIARELREAGIHPMRVKEWSNTVILRLLRNEKYVGDLCQKKTYTPDYLSHEKKYNRGAEEKVYIRNHHPDIAIIDRELWERTQAELERRSPSPDKKAKHSNRYWCSGKIWCGECGGHFVSRSKTLLNGSSYKAWRCWAAAKHGSLKKDANGDPVGCTGRSINDRTLRALVSYAVNLIVIDREKIKCDLLERIRKVIQMPQKTVDKHKLETEIESLKKKKIRIIDLAADGMIPAADMKAQNEVYTARIVELTEQLSQIEKAGSIQLDHAKDIEKYVKKIDSLLNIAPDDDSTLKEVLKKAVVHNGYVVDLTLHGIPFDIRIWYKTSGKLDLFAVDVIRYEIVGSDAQF